VASLRQSVAVSVQQQTARQLRAGSPAVDQQLASPPHAGAAAVQQQTLPPRLNNSRRER
jgi:hypothetical protein